MKIHDEIKRDESVLHSLGLGFPRSLVLSCGFEPLSCDCSVIALFLDLPNDLG